MQCAGLGTGLAWGWIAYNKLSPTAAVLPLQLGVLVFGLFSFKYHRQVVPHEHFALEDQEHAVREGLLDSSVNSLSSES